MLWLQYNDGPTMVKGNSANRLVHDSHVLLDAQMVEFKFVRQLGFSDSDRKAFLELYMITPEEGRQIRKYPFPPVQLPTYVLYLLYQPTRSLTTVSVLERKETIEIKILNLDC